MKEKKPDIKTKETKANKSQSLPQLKLKRSHFIQDKFKSFKSKRHQCRVANQYSTSRKAKL